MSRSYKKTPITGVCRVRAGEMREFKRSSSKSMRSKNEDMPDGSSYKRLQERWSAPDDGKIYVKKNDPNHDHWRKQLRK